jgi:hypothetical protein
MILLAAIREQMIASATAGRHVKNLEVLHAGIDVSHL